MADPTPRPGIGEKQLVLPGMGRAQFEGKPDWHLNEQQFNAKHRKVRSFDDLENGEPAILQAYHGTSSRSAARIRDTGFQPDTTPVAINRENGSKGIEVNALHRRTQLLSPDHAQGVYFAERSHAAHYGDPQPVEVNLRNPRVDEKLYNEDILTENPVDTWKKHDAWISKGGSSGESPTRIPENDEEYEEDYGGHYEENTGEPFRQGVVYNPKQARMLPEGKKHSPLITPVIGAPVRNRHTGEEVGKLSQSPDGGYVKVVPPESGFPDRSNVFTGEPHDWAHEEYKQWANYDVVGGHRDILHKAMNEGKYVPASAHETDTNRDIQKWPSREAVGVQAPLYEHSLTMSGGQFKQGIKTWKDT